MDTLQLQLHEHYLILVLEGVASYQLTVDLLDSPSLRDTLIRLQGWADDLPLLFDDGGHEAPQPLTRTDEYGPDLRGYSERDHYRFRLDLDLDAPDCPQSLSVYWTVTRSGVQDALRDWDLT